MAATDSERMHAAALNSACQCPVLNQAELIKVLPAATGNPTHLFANAVVYVDQQQLQKQQQLIQAIERIITLPAYQQQVLRHAPDNAQFKPAAQGVFMGYDFHINSEGSHLIEINTNAGGVLLNALARPAYQHCPHQKPQTAPASNLQAILDCFQQEWHLSGATADLRRIALVDQQPSEQFLYPEFLLFQQQLELNGIQCLIADPSQLQRHNSGLWLGDTRIDLVYNRLTDFTLQVPSHQTLLQAYLAQEVVVTPNPHAHALYADKRNLALLSDENALKALVIEEDTRKLLLENIASTRQLAQQSPEHWWQQRKQWFFKPAQGYGSKAAYRGDKLTTRVFNELLHGNYVAQKLAAPGERQLRVNDQPQALKYDLRHYTYQGQILHSSARLYQGQTTNFRTEGGGFAPVIAT